MRGGANNPENEQICGPHSCWTTQEERVEGSDGTYIVYVCELMGEDPHHPSSESQEESSAVSLFFFIEGIRKEGTVYLLYSRTWCSGSTLC